ncbi:unnamed protein product, partial [marine sediment metagenome]
MGFPVPKALVVGLPDGDGTGIRNNYEAAGQALIKNREALWDLKCNIWLNRGVLYETFEHDLKCFTGVESFPDGVKGPSKIDILHMDAHGTSEYGILYGKKRLVTYICLFRRDLK